mmetsp:Transcript_4596/g.11124  ORF Transcript_4596/g.11124 Transcript_4596/m.11124 type:complete len:788 (+) Transcript_4596:42-2405(+)
MFEPLLGRMELLDRGSGRTEAEEDADPARTRTTDYLHPPSRCSTAKQALSPSRLLFGAILVAATCAVAFLVDPGKFIITVERKDIPDIASCQRLCLESHSSEVFRKTLGGEGKCCSGPVLQNATAGAMCRPGDVSLVRFRYCKLKAKNKISECRAEADVDMNAVWTTRCEFKVVRPLWMPLCTVALLAITVMLIIQGLPAEALLIGLAALLCLLGIIARADVFSGLVDKGVTSLAVLFPLAEAVEDTGIIERVVGGLLGKPQTLRAALLRMTAAVALLSAVVSNTATVALMIPIVLTWSTRMGVHPCKLLMPLSFAAQLGGVCTLLGSSICFVAQGVVAPVYSIGLLDLTPVGVCLTVLMALVMTGLAHSPLLKPPHSVMQADRASDVYHTLFTVTSYGGIANNTVEESGLERMPGVCSVTLQEPHDRIVVAGDVLEVKCTEVGLACLRKQTGLRLLAESSLKLLGSKRRQRFLFEATVKAGSELCGSMDALDALSPVLRLEYGACYIAGPKTSPKEVPMEIREGSVLLLEADETWVTDKAARKWQSNFSLIRKVPASSPVRTGHRTDNIRDATVCLSVLGLICLVAFDAVHLDGGGILVLLLLLLIGGLTLEQMFLAMKVRILFTIAGAIAVGAALESSGIVDFLAQSLLGITRNSTALVAIFYCIAVVFGMFINNSATVAILGPLVVTAVTEHDESEPSLWTSGRSLSFALVYGAGSCFTTPLGYQTNLMVMPAGQYTFADFMKYGGVIQAAHMVCTIALIKLYDWITNALCSSGIFSSACYPEP